MIDEVLAGYCVTVFAYGPTSCGKTYTMLGTNKAPGIMARALSELFKRLNSSDAEKIEFGLSMSYLEVRNITNIFLLQAKVKRAQ